MLPNRTVLVLEDEPLLAMAIEDVVRELGLTPRIVARLEEGLELARLADLGAAVVDIRLHGEATEELVRILRARGIPFAVSTCSNQPRLPEAFSDAPVLRKPYPDGELRDVLTGFFNRSSSSATGRRARETDSGSNAELEFG